jgi:hypothetical protein
VNRGTRLAIDTAAALAIGAAGVAWGVHIVDGRADVTDIEPGDRVETAVDALRTDDVYVPPDGRTMLAADAEQRLEQVVADAPVPVHVVVWRASSEAGGEPYSFTLPEMIAEELDEPGVYIVWQGPGEADAEAAPGTRIDYGGPRLEAAGDAELRITEFVEQLEADSLIEDDGFDYWGGRSGGFAAGLLFGSGIALGAYLLVGIVRAVTGRPFRNRPRSAP